MQPEAPRVVVAGAGNWLLGEDRIGPRVIESVALRYGESVELVDMGTTALALLDHLDGQELMIIVDACVGLGEPGAVRVLDPDTVETSGPSTSIHQIGPLEALAVARELDVGRLPERIVLVAVETGVLALDRESEVVARVVETLDRLIAETGWDVVPACVPGVETAERRSP